MTTASALAPHHLAMLTQESGITAEVIAERGYRSIDGASGYTALKALGYSKQQATPSSGLLLPLHTTDGSSLSPSTGLTNHNQMPTADRKSTCSPKGQGSSLIVPLAVSRPWQTPVCRSG